MSDPKLTSSLIEVHKVGQVIDRAPVTADCRRAGNTRLPRQMGFCGESWASVPSAAAATSTTWSTMSTLNRASGGCQPL